MERGDAMLRYLIVQLRDQLTNLQQLQPQPQQHDGYPSNSSQLVLLQQPPLPDQINRVPVCDGFSPLLDLTLKSSSFINLDASSSSGGCYNLVVMPDKSESFKMLDPCHPPTAKRSQRRARGTVSCSQVMDEVIWKDFPDDLFEAVLARLPVATFFQFRSVCRKWNFLLTSDSFSQQCDLLDPSQPWLYTIGYGNDGSMLYDPCLKKWHHVALPPPPIISWFPVASAGGLVCCLNICQMNLHVVNPLTHSSKELPARLATASSRVAIGMTSNKNSRNRGYKILWLSNLGEHEVYDSERHSWSCPGSVASSVSLPLCLNFKSGTISIGDTIYFMRSRPHGLLSYNMASGA